MGDIDLCLDPLNICVKYESHIYNALKNYMHLLGFDDDLLSRSHKDHEQP